MRKINSEIINALLNCNYKAYLYYHKKVGNQTEYGLLENKLLQKYKKNFINKMYSMSPKIEVFKNSELCHDIQNKNLTYFIEPIVKSNNFVIQFDSIEILPQKDKTETLSFVPILISPNEKPFSTDKIFLCMKSILLDSICGITTKYGKIVFGKNLKTTKFAFKTYSKKAQGLINRLIKILSTDKPPLFYRNDHCQICEFQKICKIKLFEKDDLSLLGRMGQKEIQKLNNKGIFTINQLSYTYRPKKRKNKMKKPQRVEYPLKALALRNKQTYVTEIPIFLDCKTEVYLDIEGLNDENFFYLIGILVIRDGIKKHFSYWANSQEDVEKIFIRFINTIIPLGDFIIYHYGSYETKALKKINKALKSKFNKEIDFILLKSINILSLFSSHIYPPTYTNSLKDIANHIGFRWTDSKGSGIQTIVWRKKWELTKYNKFKKKLIKYNCDDCEALFLVKNWISNIESDLKNEGKKVFAYTSDLQNQSFQKWGKPKFQVKEFEEINKYSYLVMQKAKVIKNYR